MDVREGSASRLAVAVRHSFGWSRRPLLPVIAGLIVFTASSAVFGQTDRREAIDSLIQSLIESERQRLESDRPERRDFLSTPDDAGRLATKDLRDVYRMLQDFATEASSLTNDLYDARRRIPEIEPRLADILTVRARASLLADQAKNARDYRVIAADFQALDQLWRTASYRLNQISNLPNNIAQRIGRLDQYDESILKALGLGSQVDSVELIRQTAALASAVRAVVSSIQYELQLNDQRSELTLAARRAEQQANRVSTVAANRESREYIVAEYKQFQSLWGTLVTRLRATQNRYLERDIRRVTEIDQTIHKLLWLPQTIDHTELLHLTEVLQRDIDEFFSRTPLRLLISLPNSDRVLPIADEFYGVTQNFSDAITKGASREDLAYSFQFIDQSWNAFYNQFRPLRSQAALQVLAEIERSIFALRDAMQLHEGFDRSRALELAAALENDADHLNADVQRWLGNVRPAPSYRNEVLRQAADFATACRRLHTDLDRNVNIDQLRVQCTSLYNVWGPLQVSIARCNTADRDHLMRLSQNITPTLVELQTMVGR